MPRKTKTTRKKRHRTRRRASSHKIKTKSVRGGDPALSRPILRDVENRVRKNIREVLINANKAKNLGWDEKKYRMKTTFGFHHGYTSKIDTFMFSLSRMYIDSTNFETFSDSVYRDQARMRTKKQKDDRYMMTEAEYNLIMVGKMDPNSSEASIFCIRDDPKLFDTNGEKVIGNSGIYATALLGRITGL